MNKSSVDLSVDIGKLKLKNPVMPSSGTFGYGVEFSDFLNLEDLGAIILKGTTLNPKMGNPENRCIEVSGCSILSCVGLQNVGVEKLVKEKIPLLRKFETNIIVNIACETINEFSRVTEILSNTEGVSALEINLACPNVKSGGMSFASDANMIYEVVRAVRTNTDLTTIVKFHPNLVDAVELAVACENAGADAVCPIHSPFGMAIDINTRKSKLGKNLGGGLAGPGLKPASVYLTYRVAQSVKIPVIGCGGISCTEDALEFIIAGASAVEIGLYNLINPTVTIDIIKGLRNYLVNNGYSSIADIRGSLITTK